ncbi:Bug family tripartite tricarboxylate transporter substrate binding protein [Acuticoccus mangrovi]|uniref:Tripartite tricarboxylate transporter substrate binding protein n=1 Tax=Acuticoccus mangrovi TaxID=2796142 RepID=A0A934IS29_9HYPH|nr:tripartite tricarboxylate transporter substrate binding protein [Acuticoccus mangrovi]MBJ3776634.1 tripartite tricarboxylate transporter substrate binding protein [Acuticoccus mangrovi]
MNRSMPCLALGALAAVLVGFGGDAEAQSYPDKPISVIVPFSPGGQTDIASRTLADALSEALGETVSVVNRAGAGGAIGTAEMAAADTDGYTLGVTASTPLMLKPFVSDVPYTVDSFDYVCRVFENPMFFAVKVDSDIASPKALADYAGSERLRYGSSGNGSVQHLAMLQFSDLAGVEGVHVANSSDADNLRNILADVITGTLTSSSVIKKNEDTLKPIGVMSRERSPIFPDVPTFAEEGFPVYYSLWGVLVGPKGMPEDVLATLRKGCADAQSSEAFQSRMNELGMVPAYMDGAEFEPLAKEESATSKALLEKAGLIQ